MHLFYYGVCTVSMFVICAADLPFFERFVSFVSFYSVNLDWMLCSVFLCACTVCDTFNYYIPCFSRFFICKNDTNPMLKLNKINIMCIFVHHLICNVIFSRPKNIRSRYSVLRNVYCILTVITVRWLEIHQVLFVNAQLFFLIPHCRYFCT